MIRMKCLIPFYSTSTNLNVSAMCINRGSCILIARKRREKDDRRDAVIGMVKAVPLLHVKEMKIKGVCKTNIQCGMQSTFTHICKT